MIRATCGVKLIKKRRSEELTSLLSLKDNLDGQAKASGVRWYGPVLRRDNGDILRRSWILKWREEDGVGDQM